MMRRRRRLAAPVFLLLLSLLLGRCTASAVQRTPREKGAGVTEQEKTIEVSVINANFGAQDRTVGRPVVVRVRARSGRVLRQVETDSEGWARLTFSWSSDDPPAQIESVVDDRGLPGATGEYGGTIVSVDLRTSRYCIVLPASCVF
jgi:hypothetical protein